jgi:hypothetical protein
LNNQLGSPANQAIFEINRRISAIVFGESVPPIWKIGESVPPIFPQLANQCHRFWRISVTVFGKLANQCHRFSPNWRISTTVLENLHSLIF